MSLGRAVPVTLEINSTVASRELTVAWNLVFKTIPSSKPSNNISDELPPYNKYKEETKHINTLINRTLRNVWLNYKCFVARTVVIKVLYWRYNDGSNLNDLNDFLNDLNHKLYHIIYLVKITFTQRDWYVK